MIGAICWGLVFGLWVALAIEGWNHHPATATAAYIFCAAFSGVETAVRVRRLIDRWFP